MHCGKRVSIKDGENGLDAVEVVQWIRESRQSTRVEGTVSMSQTLSEDKRAVR